MRPRCWMLGLCLTLLFLSNPLHGQSSSLFIRVMGPTGPVSLAEVQVMVAGSPFLTGWTDEEGNVLVTPLPAGTYSVLVRAFGYQDVREEAVRVDAGVQRNLEIQLRVAPVELEGLTIQAERIEPTGGSGS